MKFDVSRPAGPAVRRTGNARSASPYSTRSCRRAKWAPRQTCGPSPKETCGLGGTGQVEAVRLGEGPFVSVGGGVEDDHLVAGADASVRELCVVRGGAAEGEYGRMPAQQLVHR